MQYKKTLAASALATSALAAYVPGQPWSTLTPSATFKGGITDYASTFGIAVQPIATPASVAKRAVSQIGDGQVQATTKTTSTLAPKAPISQIGDGQIQATTKTQAAPVSQIGDGQIQATTKTQAAPVSQIGDGQIQATTKTQAAPVSQIGDGQIQATTKTQAAPVSQIGDGQIQATTKTAVSQIGDGQIQATKTATAGASQIQDGQVQASNQGKAPNDPVGAVSCKVDGTLEMNLKGGILTDGKGRIGSIVANRQFQFDGPPPQAGAIFAAGWSLTPQGNLALGDNDVFYQCLSGNFYNLYDQHIGSQCTPVHLSAIDLIKC
ncbi:PIR2 [Nakaseomyces glabratus]|nr:hypothetical protein J6894_02598 [Nakaseomyces glabratus]KTB00289.1 Cell wall mannoprotein PIR1 [Nakaseomyces glabratus]QNG14678.1 PIR2 [Nakaseomyces glabratus]